MYSGRSAGKPFDRGIHNKLLMCQVSQKCPALKEYLYCFIALSIGTNLWNVLCWDNLTRVLTVQE